MRIAAMTGLMSILVCGHAVADEPTTSFVAKEYVLGRVFMSDAERRRLDLLRKTQGMVENTANVSTSSTKAKSDTKSSTKPTGYIVPSNGSPYQWIDGEFQRVATVEINSAEVSQELQITRVEVDAVDNGSSNELAPQAENVDEIRIPH